MSNEAQIQSQLAINVGNYSWQCLPGSFNADVSAYGAAGPTPGSVLATLSGTLIDLSKIITPGGLCSIQNSDLTNFVEIGMYDPDVSKFYSFMELLPGEQWVFRLARNYDNEYGAGTGTTGSGVNYYARVDPSQPSGTTAMVVVSAFNK